MFDIEKAFDRIWHNGLLFKLIGLNYPKYIICIVASFLRNRTFNLKINDKKSHTKSIPYGVPQGAVLSPSLYTLYTADAPELEDCIRAFFADDTALIASHRTWRITNESLESATQLFKDYFTKWKILLNNTKTQALLITNRRTREVPDDFFHFDGASIEWATSAKYLGLILDKKLTMKQNTEHVIEKTQKALRILYPLINRKSKLNSENKILLFKLALRPIYTYGCPIYRNMANCHKKKQVL